MKTIHKLALLLLLIPSVVLANNGLDKKRHEKSKSINKSFDVSSKATLEIYNKYGDINVTSWDQDRVEIDVKITVKGNDEDAVEDMLEKIRVEFDGSSNLVTARTFIGNKNNWSFWKKRKNISYKINYTVKMPVTNNAKLNNDYGSIRLDELEGTADISCDYGKVTLGDLKGSNSSISLDYCSSSTVDSMKDGDISIDYSKLSVESATNVNVSMDYSTMKFNSVEDLDFNADYGGLTVDNANNVEGTGDYTGLKFGTINNRLKVNSDYGSIRIKNLADGFDFVDINSEFASIKIGLAPNISFDFVIDLQYAGFKRNDGNIDMRKSIKKNNKKYYEGTYGKGNSNSKITIKSEYGSVTFQEN
jgi:hypothetical protein